MKYLLLLAVTLFFSWPYYHRMRTFDWDPAKSYVIGLVPSILIAFGIVKCIVATSNGGEYPVLPDDLTKWTFTVIAILLTGVFCWLMFTSKWCNDGSTDADGAFFVGIFMFCLCAAQGFFVTDVIVSTVRMLS